MALKKNFLSLNVVISYNPYTNSWMRLPPLHFDEHMYLWQILFRNVDETYTLLSDVRNCVIAGRFGSRSMIVPCVKDRFFIWKFKPELHSWEHSLSLDHLNAKFDSRQDFCIVASEHFIYFIGGLHVTEWRGLTLSDVDRYDFIKGQWYKVADIQVARSGAHGAAASGKVFIAGGFQKGERLNECEMYDEATNEWQFIASFETESIDILESFPSLFDWWQAVCCEL